MADQKKKSFQFRANLPRIVQFAALGLLALTVLAIVVGFYRARNNSGFHLRPQDAQLSTDVVAEVNQYERLETDGDVKKYFIKADHAKTYSDNHQELDNVYIEVYADNDSVDKLSGDRALYIPKENRQFTAYLKGNVNIETRDTLKVQTSNVVYTKSDETAVADDRVDFQRENITGSSVGAKVLAAAKRLELLQDVHVQMLPNENGGGSNLKQAAFSGNSAAYDQAANSLEVNGNVEAHLLGASDEKNTDVKSDKAVALLQAGNAGAQPTLKSLELVEHVWIELSQNGQRQTTIETAYALYEKPADRFHLKNGVHIVAGSDDPSDIKAADAVYEQTSGSIQLNGGVEITKGASYIHGNSIDAQLTAAKKIKNSVVRGGAYLRNKTTERQTEVSADEMNAVFDDAQQVQTAAASGNAKAVVTPTDNSQYTTLAVASPKTIKAAFLSGGLPSNMTADGRATVQLNAPNGANDAANKRVTADSVNVAFNDNGKDLKHAEAIGNAELYIEPLRALPANYRSTIYAPRFDCEFYPTGNNARECVGQTHTKTIREPTVLADGRGSQTMTADKLTALFSEQSNDVQTLEAAGDAKFTELDRNAVAAVMTFTQPDEVVRMRGGEPTFWDASSRAKAKEIDWDTKSQHSYLRGGVSTIYYSQKKAGNSTPFGSSDKPVFATSESMEIDQRSQTAIYTGNARAWQENNYVRADRLTIDQQGGTFNADGSVQSLLYDAKQKRKNNNSTVPVYASAGTLNYGRENRLLRYRKSVDIRQGTDRVTAESADIFLDEHNEMSKTVVENSVTITQPGRKAIGDWAQYTADNEVAVIRGNPARVDDAENGTSQGGQITVYLRDDRVYSEGASRQNPSSRIRSVYKVKNTP